MPQAVLTLNAGSSSLKFSLFEIDGSLRLTLNGQVESLDTEPHFLARGADGRILEDRPCPGKSFDQVMTFVVEWAEQHLDGDTLAGVGHRVVHGGPDHVWPEPVTPRLLAALDRIVPLAPLHIPHNLAPIRAVAAVRPDLAQVVCFDTGFHHTMPREATQFGLPREYEASGVRRYGFHGLSYEFIAAELRRLTPRAASGRVIAAHLGNGASLCAMRDGESVDTTMGFTALDGLVMGTRCGNLDPGVLLYLEQQRGLSTAEVETLLYRRSGLLGVSGGVGSDMRTLLASRDPHAREAVELFVFRIARETGALASSLGGLDGFVFTAGIGENAAEIRALVCARLGWLGVELDTAANAAGSPVISTPPSRVEVRVIPTDEERMIALHTKALIGRDDVPVAASKEGQPT